MSGGATEHVKKSHRPLDVAVLGDRTEDGAGRRVLRVRESGASLGELRPLTHGKPLPRDGEIVKLTPRDGAPGHVCDVEPQLDLGPAAAASGPARVASDAYRDGWDRIFAPPDGAPN